MRRRILVLAIALAALVSIASAGAEGRSVNDERDSGGPLDLRVLTHAQSQGGRMLHHAIRTHGSWRNRQMTCNKPDCRGSLTLWFTTDREEEYEERALYLFYWRGRLRAEMHGHYVDEECAAQSPALICTQRSWRVGPVDFRRPDSRTIVFSFRRRMLGKNVGTYGWRAHMFFRRERECRGYSSYDYWRDNYSCSDYAPDGAARYIYQRD